MRHNTAEKSKKKKNSESFSLLLWQVWKPQKEGYRKGSLPQRACAVRFSLIKRRLGLGGRFFGYFLFLVSARGRGRGSPRAPGGGGCGGAKRVLFGKNVFFPIV